ncbi:MAG TPA: hypothetical protein VI232_04670 [Reyranella sp.]|jgi:hypothetical protein
MKRTLITLALVAIAGTAGAQTAMPPSVSGATVTPPAASSGVVTTPPVNPPAMSTSGVNAPPAMAPNTANAAALPNAPGSNGAAKRIQADGYKNVQGLTRGTDGKWHGTAMRGNTMVGVVVDGRGNVSSQ